jgi:hypothetical protein
MTTDRDIALATLKTSQKIRAIAIPPYLEWSIGIEPIPEIEEIREKIMKADPTLTIGEFVAFMRRMHYTVSVAAAEISHDCG